MPWMRCGPGPAAGEDRRVGRLDGHDAHAGAALLEHLADAGERAAGADAGHERVDLAAGVGPDLLGRRETVHLGVGRVLELLRHERVGASRRPARAPSARRPAMPSAPGREHEPRAVAP